MGGRFIIWFIGAASSSLEKMGASSSSSSTTLGELDVDDISMVVAVDEVEETDSTLRAKGVVEPAGEAGEDNGLGGDRGGISTTVSVIKLCTIISTKKLGVDK